MRQLTLTDDQFESLFAYLQEVKYGCSVFQKQFDWYLSTNNQTVDFWDGMILSHNLEIV